MQDNLYERVAVKIAGLIEHGSLRPGDKLPSVRRLSKREKVSITTALQAYFVLENRGLIEARPQSGFYVRLLQRGLPPEPQVSTPPISANRVNVSELVTAIHDSISIPDIVQLGGATPNPDLLPISRLNRIVGSITRSSGSSVHQYGPTQGDLELRRQIARRSFDFGCSLSPEETVITFGCTEAVSLCLRAVASPGDTIAVESPTYYGFLQIIESLGMKALEIPAHPRTGISLDALQAAIRKHSVRACLTTSNFNNPLGSSMPDENKERLVQMLAAKEIPLIEDDIYGDLHFSKERPTVCKSFDKRGMVLLCSSFSKTLSPGFRVGWTAPGKYMDRVKRLKLMNTLSGVTITQRATAEFLKSGGYDQLLRRTRKSYQWQVERSIQMIGKYFPKGTRVSRPSGGFVLWVELPKTCDAMSLYRRALMEERISIIPGSIFSAKGLYSNFVRLNCSHPWSERIDHSLFTLGRLVSESC